jgi:hypothetical protein
MENSRIKKISFRKKEYMHSHKKLYSASLMLLRTVTIENPEFLQQHLCTNIQTHFRLFMHMNASDVQTYKHTSDYYLCT